MSSFVRVVSDFQNLAYKRVSEELTSLLKRQIFFPVQNPVKTVLAVPKNWRVL